MADSDSNTGPGRICVSIAAGSIGAALAAARSAAPAADVLEIRLDGLQDREPAPFLEAVDRPLLFTNRPGWEGGRYEGDEKTRLLPLLEAVRRGAAYVDLELRAANELRQRLLEELASTACRWIVSWHDFAGTPDREQLRRILGEQHASGAAIGKIVTMARDHHDVLRVLGLQEEAAELDFPLIAFCMGRAGMISRLATLHLGGYMTYAAPDDGAGSAPGQMPVSELRAMTARFGHDD